MTTNIPFLKTFLVDVYRLNINKTEKYLLETYIMLCWGLNKMFYKCMLYFLLQLQDISIKAIAT